MFAIIIAYVIGVFTGGAIIYFQLELLIKRATRNLQKTEKMVKRTERNLKETTESLRRAREIVAKIKEGS